MSRARHNYFQVGLQIPFGKAYAEPKRSARTDDGAYFDATEPERVMAQNELRSAPSEWLPSPMAERTLIWDVFDYILCRRSRAEREKAERRRMGRIKPIRTYRNPIFLAREWTEAMEAGDFRSQRAFARAIGLSHTRVSQVLGLLRLGLGAQKDLEALGDPLYSRKVTERKLRPIVNLPEEKQELSLREML